MSYKCARPFLEGPRDWLGRVDSRKLVAETRGELRKVIDGAMGHVLKKYYPRRASFGGLKGGYTGHSEGSWRL